MRNEAHLVLEQHLRELGIDFEREYKFRADRKWRFDYLLTGFRQFPDCMSIAIEIEGAVWTQGRHTRGSGFVRDMEKYNYAQMMGYKVFRFSTQEVLNGKAKEFLQQWSKA